MTGNTGFKGHVIHDHQQKSGKPVAFNIIWSIASCKVFYQTESSLTLCINLIIRSFVRFFRKIFVFTFSHFLLKAC